MYVGRYVCVRACVYACMHACVHVWVYVCAGRDIISDKTKYMHSEDSDKLVYLSNYSDQSAFALYG